MSTTMEDILEEQMLDELLYEAVMKNAALEQCIYIFVEGHSEELTFQKLLEHPSCGLNFQENGIVIANYNGIGNLKHMIRLLRKTLSHDRPVIVTYDDDLEGKKAEKYLNELNDPLIHLFRVPLKPVVTYRDGTKGGSFEEAFSLQCFVDACFQPGVMPSSFAGTLSELMAFFESGKPWDSQIAEYVKSKGFCAGSIDKVLRAKFMAEMCDPIPETFVELAKIALELRKLHPVRHPDDVDLSILND